MERRLSLLNVGTDFPELHKSPFGRDLSAPLRCSFSELLMERRLVPLHKPIIELGSVLRHRRVRGKNVERKEAVVQPNCRQCLSVLTSWRAHNVVSPPKFSRVKDSSATTKGTLRRRCPGSVLQHLVALLSPECAMSESQG